MLISCAWFCKAGEAKAVVGSLLLCPKVVDVRCDKTNEGGMMSSFRLYLFVVRLITMPVMASDSSGDMFYLSFRTAVLNSDINSIVSMTRFPFELRGTDDSQGVRRYRESAFKKLYKKLLAQKELVTSNGHVVESTMCQVIKEKEKLGTVDYLRKDFIRVGDFEFQLTAGKWWFTGAYLE